MSFITIRVQEEWKRVVITTEIHFQRRKLRFTDQPEWWPNQQELLWGTCRRSSLDSVHLTCGTCGSRRHVSSCDEAGPHHSGWGQAKRNGGKCTFHFITWKNRNTFASSYRPDITLPCGQCCHLKLCCQFAGWINILFWLFPGLSTHSQRYVWLDFNLCHWCSGHDHADDWLVGQNTLRAAKSQHTQQYSTFDYFMVILGSFVILENFIMEGHVIKWAERFQYNWALAQIVQCILAFIVKPC